MRLLRAGQVNRRSGLRPGRRIYDEAVREALIVVWEASDRICGKRLRPLLPILLEAYSVAPAAVFVPPESDITDPAEASSGSQTAQAAVWRSIRSDRRCLQSPGVEAPV